MTLPATISNLFSELNIKQLLKTSGIIKKRGYSAFACLLFIFNLAFKKQSIYQVISGRDSDGLMKKDTIYRFMNNAHYNWRQFLSLTGIATVQKMNKLRRTKAKIRALVIDDSPLYCEFNQSLAKLAWQWDHAAQKHFKGYRMLSMGYTDGKSFVPLDFALMSARKKVHPGKLAVDYRTHAGKRLKETDQPMNQVAVQMIAYALNQGLCASHVLMDKWFTSPKMVNQLQEIGIYLIGMMKCGKTKYFYQGQELTLQQLYDLARPNWGSNDNILASLQVQLKSGLPVKLVFVKNKNKKRKWLAIVTNDLSLSAKEIVKTYSARWQIETFFKTIKSDLRLVNGSQTRSYAALVCHTTIVFLRYLLLSWHRYKENWRSTIGSILTSFSEQVADLPWVTVINDLAEINTQAMARLDKENQIEMNKNLEERMNSWPVYIRNYLAGQEH